MIYGTLLVLHVHVRVISHFPAVYEAANEEWEMTYN